MHRRARHLNAASAGAMFVLDARYINQADNSAVSTWKDRSSNGYDVTQATGANQPTLQTGEVGGSSIVRFDGSNDYLIRSDTGFPTGNLTIIGVHKQSSLIPSGGNYRSILQYGSAALGQAIFHFYGDDTNVPNDGFGISNYGDAIGIENATLVYNIASTYRIGTTYYVRLNGGNAVTKTMTVSTTLFGANGLAIGSFNAAVGIGSYLGGDIGSVMVFNSALNDSLRKRIEHSSAFSFKLICA